MNFIVPLHKDKKFRLHLSTGRMETNKNTSLWKRIRKRIRQYRIDRRSARFFDSYYKKKTTEERKRKILDVSRKIMETIPSRYNVEETAGEREQREQESLQFLFRRIKARKRKLFAGYVVAIVVVAVLCAAGWNMAGRSGKEAYITYIPGQDSTLTLKDSSIVHLKGGSTLTVPEDFSEAKRYVRLDGEAYFEVRKHLAALFTVDMDGLRAIVHGTRFNALNAAGLEVKQISVSQGKVEVYDHAKDRSYGILTKGKEMTYHTATGKGEIRLTDPDRIAEWRDKTFYMENGSLEEFKARLLRSFGKKLVVCPGALPERIEAHIDVSYTTATPRLVMETFCSVYSLEYKIEGNTITIWRRA